MKTPLCGHLRVVRTPMSSGVFYSVNTERPSLNSGVFYRANQEKPSLSSGILCKPGAGKRP